MLELIAFDADDTLWHNERLYHQAEKDFASLLSGCVEEEYARQYLLETEKRNIPLYGYGIKSFALSMIEAGIDLSAGAFGSAEISGVIDIVKGMLVADVELLEHVHSTVHALAESHALMLITKGDLRDQENKLQKSGLQSCFDHVEVVHEKNMQVYSSLLEKHTVAPRRFLMVGNSIKSDVLPVLSLGGCAVHIPYPLTWAYEETTVPVELLSGYHQLDHIGDLPGLIRRLWSG